MLVNNLTHLAIIADGNRRWAKSHGLPMLTGYMKGAATIESCCEWAIENAVQHLTVFCFSTENWSRPKNEVDLLMNIAYDYLISKRKWYVDKDIRVRFLGRRDRFNQDFINVINHMESSTGNCKSLTLTLCIDYGGRDEIARAIAAGAKTEEEITNMLCRELPEPDLIIRTGGFQRLSNFLLWQSAYSELYFTDTLFPALSAYEFQHAINRYYCTKRNFGGE
jgi:undecaprenyl diphosphate synthase